VDGLSEGSWVHDGVYYGMKIQYKLFLDAWVAKLEAAGAVEVIA
jgi:hypothetical protein